MSGKRFLVDFLINLVLLIIFINFFVIALNLDWMSTNLIGYVYIMILVLSVVCAGMLFLSENYLSKNNSEYMFPKLYEDTQKTIYCLTIKNVGFINANDITVSISSLTDKVEFAPEPKNPNEPKEWFFNAINKGSFKEIIITLEKGTTLGMEDLKEKTHLKGNQAANLLMVEIDRLGKNQEQDVSILKNIHYILFNNAFLFLYRSIFLIFVFFALTLIISPVQIIVTPQTITENISAGDFLTRTISIENIGTGLTYLNITQRSNNIGSVNKLIEEINITSQNIERNLSKIDWTNEKSINLPIYKKNITNGNYNLSQIRNRIMMGDVTIENSTDYIDRTIANISFNIQKLNDSLTDESNKRIISNMGNIFGEISRMLHKYNLFISLSDISYSDIPKDELVFVTTRIDCSKNEIPGEYIGEIILAPKANERLESKTSIPIIISVKANKNAGPVNEPKLSENMLRAYVC